VPESMVVLSAPIRNTMTLASYNCQLPALGAV